MARLPLYLTQLRYLRSARLIVNPTRIPVEETKAEEFDADREFRRLKTRFVQSRQLPTDDQPVANPWAKQFQPGSKLPADVKRTETTGKNQMSTESAKNRSGPMTKLYTLAPLVDSSASLQLLVELGVNLGELERKENAADVIVKLSIENDIRPMVKFLMERAGLKLDEIGHFITKNPWIFQQKLVDLEARLNYLESKKFTAEMISSVVSGAVYWLNFQVKTIDYRLGWIQTEFGLTGDQVRSVITAQPKLITFGVGYLQLLRFTFSEEFGFSLDEMKGILLKAPKVWLKARKQLQETFDCCHNEIGFSHERLMQFPLVLKYGRNHIRQRYGFLKAVGRDQFDPTKPNYVSLEALVCGSDEDFCSKVTKTSVGQFNDFLKTL